MHLKSDIIENLKEEESNKHLINTFKKFNEIEEYKENLKINSFNNFQKSDLNIDLLKTYKLIIESTSVAIIFTNHDEKIIYLNKYTEKLLQFKKTDLLMKHISYLYPPKEWQRIRSKNIRNKGIEHHFETKMLKKNGSIIDIDLSLSILKNKSGNIVGSLGVVRDISDRIKIESNLKLKDYAILSSINAICFINLSKKIIYVNPSFLKMWQYDSEKHLTGKSILKICRFKIDFLEKIQYAIENDFWSGELLTKDKNEKIFVLLTEINLLKDNSNNPTSIMISFLDITEKSRMKKKLEWKNKEINQLLIQKDEFINQLGHDLKNPLNPLLNLLPILYENENDNEKKDMISILNRNVLYMKELVSKMIKLAKLNSPNTIFNFEIFNFYDLLYDVMLNNKFLLDEKKIQIKNNVLKNCTIMADRFRISEVLNNIISNSVKYSNDNGKIIIKSKKKDNIFEISIIDTGIGMTKDQINKIFTEFYKGDSSRHDFKSSGLGLSICKRIVNRHGGKIWASSNGLNKGSTITFTINTNDIENLNKIDNFNKCNLERN